MKSVEKPAAPAGLKPEVGVKQEDVTNGETEEAAEATEATELEAAAKDVKTEAAALVGLEVSELICLKSDDSVEATLVELVVFPLPPVEPAFCKGGGGTPWLPAWPWFET